MAKKSTPAEEARDKVEKRGVEREPYTCAVIFDWTVRDKKLLGLMRGQGTIANIHACGIGMISDYPVSAGDVLKVYLPVEGTRILLPVFSEVRWARPAGNRFYAGIRFLA
jgi:hypothetical protein